MVDFNEKHAIARATDFIFDYVRYTYFVKNGTKITISKLMDFTNYDKTALYDFKSGARKAPVSFLNDLLSVCGMSFNDDINFLRKEKQDFETFLLYFFNMQEKACLKFIDDKLPILDEISCSYAWEYALFYKFYHLITHKNLENVIELTKYILDKVSSPISLLVFAMYHDYRLNKNKYNLEKMNLVNPATLASSSILYEAINNYYVAIDMFNKLLVEDMNHSKPSLFFKHNGYMLFYTKLKILNCSVMLFDLNVDQVTKELTSVYQFLNDDVPKSIVAHVSANLAYCYFLQENYVQAKKIVDASLESMSDLEQTVFICFKNLMQSETMDNFIYYLTQLDQILVANILLKKLTQAMCSHDLATIEQLLLNIYLIDVRKDLLLFDLLVLKHYFALLKVESLAVEIVNNYIALLK